MNWSIDGLKHKPWSKTLKIFEIISNFGKYITSTQTFLLSASSEKTKTITTTLRLLFYVSILWVDQKQKWINFKNDNTVCLCPWSNFSSLNMVCCISMGYPKFFGLWQAPLLISSYKGAKTSIKEGVLWTTIGLLFKVRMKTHMWKTVFYLLNMHAPL